MFSFLFIYFVVCYLNGFRVEKRIVENTYYKIKKAANQTRHFYIQYNLWLYIYINTAHV